MTRGRLFCPDCLPLPGSTTVQVAVVRGPPNERGGRGKDPYAPVFSVGHGTIYTLHEFQRENRKLLIFSEAAGKVDGLLTLSHF